MQLPTEDRYLLTRSELLDRLAVLLGGRAAEALVYGEVSTGAQNDLQRAADIARRMVKEYGMSERLGTVAYESERRPLFLPTGNGVGNLGGKEYSEETAREIDQEIKRIVDESEGRVHQLLTRERDRLSVVAARLLEKEVLDCDKLRTLLGTREALPPGASHG